MCGIALLLGAPLRPIDRERFGSMSSAISPRGESLETAEIPAGLLATSRLKIVDRERARQPWPDATGRWLLCYNGEIFNHAELRAELLAEGRSFRSSSDTEVVMEAVLSWGQVALLRFRGEFAFALVDLHEDRLFLARDPAGIKPLYHVSSEGRLHLASEVKALVGLGAPITEIPPGHCGWAELPGPPVLTPYLDLLALGAEEEPIDDVEQATSIVAKTLRDAIARRVDTDLPVAVVLSGGLDSSIVATEVARLHPDCVAFTVGAPGSEDLEYARRLTAELGIEHVVVELNPRQIGATEVREAVRIAEATEYGDAINAVISLAVFKAIHERGIKVALVGDGSDELFGGYDMYRDVDPSTARRLFLHKIRQLSRTELQRVDRTSMGQCVEARVPYLDLDMLLLSMRIPLGLKVRDGYEKWILRQAFADTLPRYVLDRHKNPMSHSSGLHERIRLYKPLMARWYRSCGYEDHAPMHRDFSIELARAHNDFEAALVAAERHEDYSALEQLRDLAGALRWNLKNALQPGSSSRAGR